MAEVNRGAVDDARQAPPQLLLGSMGPIGIEWFAEMCIRDRMTDVLQELVARFA